MVVLGSVSFAAQPLRDAINRGFAAQEHWQDGRAEIATYDATRNIYGQQRQFTAHLITVTEDFTKEYYTKADWPYGQKPVFPVVKQNYAAVIPAGNYDYHFATNFFARGDNFGEAVKLVTSSQEWCGITAKTFELWREPARQVYISYWEGEGTGERLLDRRGDAYFEEELFLTLRGLEFEDGLRAGFRLYNNQTTNRARVPRAEPAELNVARTGDGWQANVETADGRMIEYLFHAEYPHVLREFRHSDGRTMTLRSAERHAYWIGD